MPGPLSQGVSATLKGYMAGSLDYYFSGRRLLHHGRIIQHRSWLDYGTTQWGVLCRLTPSRCTNSLIYSRSFHRAREDQ